MALPNNIQIIGGVFVNTYYKALHSDPNTLACYFDHDSILSRSQDNHEEEFVYGQAQIILKLASMEKQTKFFVDSIDIQEACFNSILLMTTGWAVPLHCPPRRFVQSFVLAPVALSAYFYIRNDMLRYISEKTTNEFAISPPAPIKQVQEPDPMPDPKELEQPIKANSIKDILQQAPHPMTHGDSTSYAGIAAVPVQDAPVTNTVPLKSPSQQQKSSRKSRSKKDDHKDVKEQPETKEPRDRPKKSTFSMFVRNPGTQEELTSFFSKFGKIANIDMRDKKNIAYVNFLTEGSLNAAISAPKGDSQMVCEVRKSAPPASRTRSRGSSKRGDSRKTN